MKNTIKILAGFALLFATVQAASDTVTLKPDDMISLLNALSALDNGTPHIVKQGDGQPDKVVTTPYDLPGTARLTLYRDMRILANQVEDLNKTKASIVKAIWGDRTPDEVKDKAEMAKFNAKWAEVQKTGLDVPLGKVKYADLRLEVNAIPLVTLNALDPLLTEK